MSDLNEASLEQYEDMLYLRSSVGVLAPLLNLTLEAKLDVQALAGYPPTSSLVVTDGVITYRCFGGHVVIWGRNAKLEGTNYIDFAMRSIFGRFIQALGQTKWKSLLKEAGFEAGQLPEDF